MMLATASLPLCLVVTCRAPPPRMALDDAGAAIAIRDLDVWAGSNNLIESFDWRIMHREPATQHVQRAETREGCGLVPGPRSEVATRKSRDKSRKGHNPKYRPDPRIALQLLGLGKHILKL